MEEVLIPAGLIRYCVLILSVGLAGIFISGIFWVLTQIAKESW